MLNFLSKLEPFSNFRLIFLLLVMGLFIISGGLSYTRGIIILMIEFIIYNEVVRIFVPRFIPIARSPLNHQGNFMLANIMALDSLFLMLLSSNLMGPFIWLIPILPIVYTYFAKLDRLYMIGSSIFITGLIYIVLAPHFLYGDYNVAVLALAFMLFGSVLTALYIDHLQRNRVKSIKVKNPPQNPADMEHFRVGLVQFAPVIGAKDNIKKALQQLSDHGVQPYDIWVFPELSNSGYNFSDMKEVEESSDTLDSENIQLIKDFAREHQCCIIAGMNLNIKGKYYNSSVSIDESGLRMVYHKTHLFYREKLYFAPGDSGFGVFNYHGANIGVMICFDWYFPEAARTLALMGADIIAHPSNLVLPHCPDSMPVRCRENRVFAVTCNRVGIEHDISYIGQSQITAYNGDILHRADKVKEEAYAAEIEITKARNKNLNDHNNLFDDRKPEFYKL